MEHRPRKTDYITIFLAKTTQFIREVHALRAKPDCQSCKTDRAKTGTKPGDWPVGARVEVFVEERMQKHPEIHVIY